MQTLAPTRSIAVTGPPQRDITSAKRQLASGRDWDGREQRPCSAAGYAGCQFERPCPPSTKMVAQLIQRACSEASITRSAATIVHAACHRRDGDSADIARAESVPKNNASIELNEFRPFNETEFLRTSDGHRSERGAGFLPAVRAVAVPHEHQLFDFKSDAATETTSSNHVVPASAPDSNIKSDQITAVSANCYAPSTAIVLHLKVAVFLRWDRQYLDRILSNCVANMDTISPQARSALMARIRSKNTAPERTVRSILHRLGFRFRLHGRDLLGKPDIVLPRHRKIILVHGCFWHGHTCALASKPKSNRSYWKKKMAANYSRDARVENGLVCDGWSVLVLWECDIRKHTGLIEKLTDFMHS